MKTTERANNGNQTLDLSSEVWGIDHIACYTLSTRRSALKLTRRPDFPRPIHLVKGEGRWLGSEVKAHLQGSRQVAPKPARAAVAPLSMRTRPRRVSA